jgi:hypothetical protein
MPRCGTCLKLGGNLLPCTNEDALPVQAVIGLGVMRMARFYRMLKRTMR